eukprot:6199525-Pleurochrysis_carterae.AAC.6
MFRLLFGQGLGLRKCASSLFSAQLQTPPPSLLLPSAPFDIWTRMMRVKTSVRKRCEHCYMVRRGKIVYNYCKVHPRHKARQGGVHGLKLKKYRH